MEKRLSPQQLDEILTLQLNVAWAGEAAGSPPRLGWWKSDLVDSEAGGDLFARLTPKTAAWASLILVRAVAIRVEEAALATFHARDKMWTLFHLGFAMDEQLEDRLAFHRSQRSKPEDVFGERYLVGKPWSKDGFAAELGKLGKPTAVPVPNGRKVFNGGSAPVEACKMIAAALLPLERTYPLPYVEAP